jgi:hypothetical protein
MKYFLGLILLGTALISCNKHLPDFPQVEVSRDSLIVSNTWQIKHIYSVQNNVVFFYERGGQDNTWNFDNDFLKFNKGGTGTYKTGSTHYDITWQFDNDDKTELSYVIYNYANGQPSTGLNHSVKLENVFLSYTSFRYSEIYTNENGTHTVSSVYREPKIK